MTVDETAAETPVEESEGPSRAAGGCVLVIAASAAGGVAYAVPELGYFVAGLTITTVVRKAHGWVAKRLGTLDNIQGSDEQDTVDIVATLHQLSPAGTANVRLTQLQAAADLPDTKAVRALLDDAGIPVETGVRAGGKNGPGVHHRNIPRSCGAPSGGCWCRSDANTNTNNSGGEGPEKGFVVTHTGQAGTTVYDLFETHSRHHITRT